MPLYTLSRRSGTVGVPPAAAGVLPNAFTSRPTVCAGADGGADGDAQSRKEGRDLGSFEFWGELFGRCRRRCVNVPAQCKGKSQFARDESLLRPFSQRPRIQYAPMQLKEVVLELSGRHQCRVQGRSQPYGVQRLSDEHYLRNLQPKPGNLISSRSPRRCLVCSGEDEGDALVHLLTAVAHSGQYRRSDGGTHCRQIGPFGSWQ
jgi:hypothetical protein